MLNPPHLLTPNERINDFGNHNYNNPPPFPHNPNMISPMGMHPNGPKPRRRKPRPPASVSKLNRPLTRFFCNDCKKKFRSRILANRNNNAVQHYCSLYGKIITRKVESHSNKCKGDHGMGPCVVKRTDDDPDSDGEDETKAAYYADKGKAPRQRKRRSTGAYTKNAGNKRKRNEFDNNNNNINYDMNAMHPYGMQNNKRLRMDGIDGMNNNSNVDVPPFEFNDGTYYSNGGYVHPEGMNNDMPPPPPMIDCFDDPVHINGDTTQSTSMSPNSSIPLPINNSDLGDCPPPPDLEPIENENANANENENEHEHKHQNKDNNNVCESVVPEMIEIGQGIVNENQIESGKMERCKNRAVVIGVSDGKAPALLSLTDLTDNGNEINGSINNDKENDANNNNNESDEECINDDLSDNEDNANNNEDNKDKLNKNENDRTNAEDDDDDEDDFAVLAIPDE